MNTYRSQGQTNYVKQQKENKKEGEGVSARCKYVEAKERAQGGKLQRRDQAGENEEPEGGEGYRR